MHLNGEAYLPGTEASGKTVRIEAPAPGVRLLTLDRPDRLNAMSGELIRDLHRALDQVAADDECRVVVLTGAGPRPAVGDRVVVIPNHVCTTVNLVDELHVVADGQVTGRWPVDARGRNS